MIKDSFLQLNFQISDVNNLAIELWRLEKKIKKIELSKDIASSVSNSIEKIKSILTKNQIEVVDFTGLSFNEGLNVDVLSVIDERKHKAFISETIEPMIKYDGKIVKRAKVIVTK